MGVFINVCLCAVSVYVQVYYMGWVAYCSIADSFVRSEPVKRETRTRSGFVLVVDPIDWQFEDRSWLCILNLSEGCLSYNY